jgi:Protein of unknown function (DUF3435)
VATTSLRSQVLGHSRADIYDRYYQSQKVRQDVQAAFLETAEHKALIRALGNMSLSLDSNVPKGLNDEDKQAAERNSDLVGECERRSRLAEQMQMEYGSVLKAKGTDLSAEYARLNTYVRNLRNKLRQDAFNAKREAYFEGIDTHIIEQQLQGLCSQKFEVGDEQKVDFSFDERIRLAHNLFPIGSEENENIIYSRRLEVIADWVLLCNLRSPRNRKLSTDAAMSPDDVTDPAIFPIKCPGTQCLFCLGDTQLTVGARTYCFANPSNLDRHEQTYHFPYLPSSKPFSCPHPKCAETLYGVAQFQEHARSVHNNLG